MVSPQFTHGISQKHCYYTFTIIKPVIIEGKHGFTVHIDLKAVTSHYDEGLIKKQQEKFNIYTISFLRQAT